MFPRLVDQLLFLCPGDLQKGHKVQEDICISPDARAHFEPPLRGAGVEWGGGPVSSFRSV